MALIAVITTVLVAFGAVDYLQQRTTRYQELHANIASHADQLASSLALPLWNFQDDQAVKIIENAFRDKAIVAVLVKDTITRRVVAGRMADESGVLQAIDAAPSFIEPLSYSSTITFNSRDIGELTVWGTPKHVRAALRQSLIRQGFSIALVNAALVALLSLILNKTVVRPLRAVETYALTVSTREKDEARVPGGFLLAEIQNLRDSIVIMVEKLRFRYQALETSQRELAEAERSYRDLFENAPAGIYRATAEGRIVSANEAMARILGFESRARLVDTMLDLERMVGVEGASVQEVLATLRTRDEISDIRIRFRRADGDIRIGTLHVRGIFDESGQLEAYDAILDDTTDRTRAEQQLIDAHQFIQNILDSMPSQVIGIDEDGLITHYNSAAAAVSVAPTNFLVGHPLTQAFPRLSAHIEHIREALREGKPVSLVNQPHLADGHIRQENILIFPVTRAGSRGAVIRLDDVTDHAKMEELILQSEKMMSLGGLAAGMAHEINNPLAGILQGVQNIIRRTSADFRPNVDAATESGCSLECVRAYLERRNIFEFLTGIRDSGERAAKIVANMLSFTRRAQTAPSPNRLDQLIERSIELASTDYDLKKKYDFKQIEIIREFQPNMPHVPCVPMEIEQVVINLLRNAAQAMASHHKEGVTPRIVLRLRQAGNKAEIEVEDNGPGIQEMNRRKVFEPFYTTKKPGEGTGLGLSVSYFIITRNHGGTIRVESEPGKGARFIIQLPIRA
ncbi:MAG: ATP-binding protein [Acidobacteriota bacterium]